MELENAELFMCGNKVQNLYLMRGVPGCGKSFRASELSKATNGVIFSADHFYGEGEEYRKNWSPQKAHLGHRDCEAKCLSAMKAKKPVVIIDNTNIALQSFRTYLDYATDHDYTVTFVYPQSSWWVTRVEPFLRNKKHPLDLTATQVAAEIAKTLAQKTVHGVPEATISDMMIRFQWVKFDDYLEATEQRLAAMKAEIADLEGRCKKLQDKYL